jgi:hypothetical protein
MQGTLATCIVTTAAAGACDVANAKVAAASTVGFKYYQPKETSDKVYAGLPRFAKGESMKFVGIDATAAAGLSGKANVACGTAKALLGASHLVAGAAVAFGAAALAF